MLHYFQKAHQKVWKFPEEKDLLLINIVDAHKIEYTLVPSSKGKSDLWKHFNLHKQKMMAKLMLMLLYVHSAILWSNLWEAHQTCQCIWSATIPKCCLGHLLGTNERLTHLSASVNIKYQHVYCYIFCICTQLYFGIWQKNFNVFFFGRHCLREVFQTLHDYYLARGLAIHTRFYDLDLISRSQVCQNHRLRIVFSFLPTVVQWCMVTTYIKKIKLSILCVTDVYLRDINSVFCSFALEC